MIGGRQSTVVFVSTGMSVYRALDLVHTRQLYVVMETRRRWWSAYALCRSCTGDVMIDRSTDGGLSSVDNLRQ